MIVGGILLLIVAVVCYFIARSQASKLEAMNAADTYTAQMLGDLESRVTRSLGAEALAESCEVAGVIESDTPLIAPLSQTACVAYTYVVTREYEEDVTLTDAEGKVNTRTDRSTETLESEDRRASFWVRDATGRTLGVPEGAEVDLGETSNRFER